MNDASIAEQARLTSRDSNPTPRKRARRRRETALQYAILVVYCIVFAIGVILSGVLAYTKTHYGNFSAALVAPLVIAVLVFILYYAEGAELAVTKILDRDEDQIPERQHERVRWLREHNDDFLTGRQLFVVLAVLLLGLICDWLYRSSVALTSDAAGLVNLSMPVMLRNTILFPPMKLYAYIFPAFSVLLFAQLYSKFVIHRRPQRFFDAYWTQLVILCSVPVGHVVRLGLPAWLVDAVVKKQCEDDVGASRLQLYKAQATFRDGIGFEKVSIALTIDPVDGSTHVEELFDLKAFAGGNSEMNQEEGWDGPVLGPPEVDVVDLPEHCGDVWKTEPIFESDDKIVKFDFGFDLPLIAGDAYRFSVNYDVGPKASKVTDNESDVFSYDVARYPARLIEFSATLKDYETSAIVLANPRIAVKKVSYDEAMNAREALRHAGGVKKPSPDCISFTVKYPLLPAQYLFTWQVRRKFRKTNVKRLITARSPAVGQSTDDSTLYGLNFAYGSNLRESRRASRCPNVVSEGAVLLSGYRLELYGAADVEPDANSTLPALALRLSPEDERELDRREGVPGSYTKAEVTALRPDGSTLRGYIYRMTPARRTRGLRRPTTDYLEHLVKGYHENKLDLDVLSGAIARSLAPEQD